MHRVVITGYGAVSPLGLTAEKSWQSAVAGISGLGPITLFDVSNFPVQMAAELKNFVPEEHLDRKEARRMDRFEQMGAVAADEAIKHSGLEVTEENSYRIGVIISSAVGGLSTMVDQILTVTNEGARKLSPFAIPRIMGNGASGMVSIAQGIRGPAFSVASACASASDGIGTALQLLRGGVIDVALAGGTEAGITGLGIGTFYRIGAYSSRLSQTPSPFSANRDGLVMGEGAAVLVLETLEHAKARGATIFAELAGYGATADAFHITAPTEDGAGSSSAIMRALDDAKINPEDVDYINAHGTGTPLNDTSETRAIKRIFGAHAYEIPISSTKSMTGHMMGATAALEAVFCLGAIRDCIAPPTINYSEPDDDCDLDYVPNQAREVPIKVAVSHAFGFGGHNSVLVIRKYEG
jgi:3-oxoacyl-[acyl-carrier-protein] synthase II